MRQKRVYNVKFDDNVDKYIVVSRVLKTKNPKGTPQHRCYYVSRISAQKEVDKRNRILEFIRNF